jgi:cbb3-type cytochrome c oxidase subunit II
LAGESVFDHPFLWGSKRTGPDLARVGGRYSDDWHRIHLRNPRDVVPESNMPAYPYLQSPAAADTISSHMLAMKRLGIQYTNEQISAKISEIVRPKQLFADGQIIYQTVENLHIACPKNLGDWYFTGDYPTPGGNRVVNRAFMNFYEGKDARAY